MPSVSVFAVNVTGDIGGTGISRFHVKKTDGSPLLPADCSTAAAAIQPLFGLTFNQIPSNINWAMQPVVQQIDEASAAITGQVAIPTVPGPSAGMDSGQYVAGTGARIQWVTATVHNRRLMRAATFMVPLGNAAFAGNGALTTAVAGTIASHANGVLTALAAGSMELVSYHRPTKGTLTGGVAGPITAAKVSTQPASLRSRRS